MAMKHVFLCVADYSSEITLDGSHDPAAEIQRHPTGKWSKLFMKHRERKAIILDPRHELADCTIENNVWLVE